MRALVIALTGLVAGAMLAMFASNTLRLRNAYPRGVMVVMQHHLAGLTAATRSGQCPPAAAHEHLQRLEAISPEILPAFAASQAGNADFRRHAEQLRQSIATALQQPPADCPALTHIVTDIGQACESCHRQYR